MERFPYPLLSLTFPDWLQIPGFLYSAPFWAMILLCIVFVCGFLATILPIAPGNLIVWAGIVFHRLWVPDHSVSWTFIWISGGFCLLAIAGDSILGWWGAKRFGATWRGGVGSVVGGIAALFIPPQLLTLFVMPFIGALLFELLGGRGYMEAQRAGWGTFLGNLMAMAFKVMLTTAMIAGFFILR